MEMRGDHAGRFPFMRPEEREVAHLADFMAANPLNADRRVLRSEEHTSELQSLMRTSYAVFCLKKKIKNPILHQQIIKPHYSKKHNRHTIKPYTTHRNKN